jgi:hypothetical protein
MTDIAIHPKPHISIHVTSLLTLVAVLMLLSTNGNAETKGHDQILVQRIQSDTGGGYGYRLQYIVPAPIDTFWSFKTDFTSKILLTNDELLDHRVIQKLGNGVITENRYAFAPGMRFQWKTTVIRDQYRLEFELLNAKDLRHDFHFGSIQLTPVGNHTRVTQIAHFNFRGASLWVQYPWYGGMKYTLTKNARWEQKAASRYEADCMVAKRN